VRERACCLTVVRVEIASSRPDGWGSAPYRCYEGCFPMQAAQSSPRVAVCGRRPWSSAWLGHPCARRPLRRVIALHVLPFTGIRHPGKPSADNNQVLQLLRNLAHRRAGDRGSHLSPSLLAPCVNTDGWHMDTGRRKGLRSLNVAATGTPRISRTRALPSG